MSHLEGLRCRDGVTVMNKEAPPVSTRAQSGDPEDASLQVVMSERRQLIGVAYRLLGSLGDPEDGVPGTKTPR
jgi:hypothetical protein